MFNGTAESVPHRFSETPCANFSVIPAFAGMTEKNRTLHKIFNFIACDKIVSIKIFYLLRFPACFG
jgi:hypothetical protein